MRVRRSAWRVVVLALPEWRNGRLGGLKSPFPRGSVGSSPTTGTPRVVAIVEIVDLSGATCGCVQCRRPQAPTTACAECGAPMTAPVELVRELLYYRDM